MDCTSNSSVESKTCSKCKVEKPLTEYSKDKYNPDGLTSSCKPCRAKSSKEYRVNNPEKYKASYKIATAKHYAKHKDTVKALTRKYYKAHREESIEYQKKYRIDNKDAIIEKSKMRYELKKEQYTLKKRENYYLNSEKYKQRQREYNKRTTVERCLKAKIYREANREECVKRSALYAKQRIAIDPVYRLRKNLSCRVKAAMKRGGWKKSCETGKMIGTDYSTLKKHIERQFKKGMTWENRREWHLDHIIPLASAKTKEELIILCHYTNLQPLWARDNIVKGDKILPVQMKIAI